MKKPRKKPSPPLEQDDLTALFVVVDEILSRLNTLDQRTEEIVKFIDAQRVVRAEEQSKVIGEFIDFLAKRHVR